MPNLFILRSLKLLRVVKLLCAILLALNLRAQVKSSPPFKGGETLYYNVRYTFAKGAEVVFSVEDTTINGRNYYHLKIDGRTTGIVKRLYPLHDVYHSYTSTRTHLPIKAIRNVKEQSYKDYKVDLFDRHTIPDSTIVTRENGEKIVLPKKLYDLVALGYALRVQLSQQQFTTNSIFSFPTFFNAEYFPFAVRYLGEETIRTTFGEMRCYKFVPRIQKGELFKENDALSIWFTTDSNHLPIRIEFKLFIGSMVCELVTYQNLVTPLNIEK